MAKVFQTLYHRLYHYYPEYATIQDTKGLYSDEITFVMAPDSCEEGDVVLSEGNGFIRPATDVPMPIDQEFIDAEDYRATERSALKDVVQFDLMDAMEHLIDGDQSKDWAEIVRTLRQFIADVDATKDQQGYPWEVVYPDVPDMGDQ